MLKEYSKAYLYEQIVQAKLLIDMPMNYVSIFVLDQDITYDFTLASPGLWYIPMLPSVPANAGANRLRPGTAQLGNCTYAH